MADTQDAKRKGQPDALPAGPERLARPVEVVRLRFEDLLYQNRVNFAGLIPIEAVAAGDEQVFAARETGKMNSPRIELDRLRMFPSVSSIASSTEVNTRTELPHIRELLYPSTWSRLLPDHATFRNLPGLDTLFATGAASNVQLMLDELPRTMARLAIARSAIADVSRLAQLEALEMLKVVHLLPGDSLAPIGGLSKIRYLWIGGPAKEWKELRRCERLEEVHLMHFGAANLRQFRGWQRLRDLSVSKGPKSLDGIEGFQELQRIHLIMGPISDLSPLEHLPNLAEVKMVFMKGCSDLTSLGRLPALRRLEIAQPALSARDVVHVHSLKPLSDASKLEEVVLLGTAIDDGDLMPLAEIPALRRVRLGQDIGADPDVLRRARPDIEIQAMPQRTRTAGGEPAGAVTIHRPSPGVRQWSIFEDLTEVIGGNTNYAAEARLRRALSASNAELLRRLSFDTESGAVGIYADAEADIRAVAGIITRLANDRA